MLLSSWFCHLSALSSQVVKDQQSRASLSNLAKCVVPHGPLLFSNMVKDQVTAIMQDEVLTHIQKELIGPVSDVLIEHYSSPVHSRLLRVHNRWLPFYDKKAKIKSDILFPGSYSTRGSQLIGRFLNAQSGHVSSTTRVITNNISTVTQVRLSKRDVNDEVAPLRTNQPTRLVSTF